MWFLRVTPLEFTSLGTNALSKCLATKMLGTRSTKTMSKHSMITMHHYKQQLLPKLLFLLIVLLLPLHQLMKGLEIGRMWSLWLFSCWLWLFGWDWPCLGNVTAMSRPIMTLIHLWSLLFASPASDAFLSRKLLNCLSNYVLFFSFFYPN
jgi:hypothetical protein